MIYNYIEDRIEIEFCLSSVVYYRSSKVGSAKKPSIVNCINIFYFVIYYYVSTYFVIFNAKKLIGHKKDIKSVILISSISL